MKVGKSFLLGRHALNNSDGVEELAWTRQFHIPRFGLALALARRWSEGDDDASAAFGLDFGSVGNASSSSLVEISTVTAVYVNGWDVNDDESSLSEYWMELEARSMALVE